MPPELFGGGVEGGGEGRVLERKGELEEIF